MNASNQTKPAEVHQLPERTLLAGEGALDRAENLQSVLQTMPAEPEGAKDANIGPGQDQAPDGSKRDQAPDEQAEQARHAPHIQLDVPEDHGADPQHGQQAPCEMRAPIRQQDDHAHRAPQSTLGAA